MKPLSPLQQGIVGGEHAPPRLVNLKTTNLDALFVTALDGKSPPVSLRNLIDGIKEEVFTDLLQDVPAIAKAVVGEDHG